MKKNIIILSLGLALIISILVNICFVLDEDREEYIQAKFVALPETKEGMTQYLQDKYSLNSKDARLAIEIINQLELEKEKTHQRLIELMGRESTEKFLRDLESQKNLPSI